MKIIEACLKLYNDKDHYTNSNTNCQTGDINECISSVARNISECSFKIILKHKIKVVGGLLYFFAINILFSVHLSLCHSLVLLILCSSMNRMQKSATQRTSKVAHKNLLHPIPLQGLGASYSVLKLFTGLAIAAFIA
jgi:hypothetical protein